uniref:DUF4220 domain-containing protein n=1 Tax=Oryza punctata TaxID=4537 RepID=A0A0E0LR67_ORYPU
MGTLSSALQWWEEWQLRVLVLASLGVQCLLAIFSCKRRSRVPPLYRLFIWLSYIGSDAIAIYALATLFNRQKKVHYNNGSHDLEVVWAPILLIHLGGQIFITAYKIEDNELWMHRILTASYQITLVLYVFCTSWSSSADKRLLAATILLFMLGILKCFEKPMALKAVSLNSLVSSSDLAQRATTESIEKELESFIKQARASVIQASQDYSQVLDDELINSTIHRLHQPTNELFVDSTHPYPIRLDNLKLFLCLVSSVGAYFVIQDGLSNIFNLLYTRNKFMNNHTYATWPLTMALAISAIGLLHSSHKQAYSHIDVIVTFVMVYGTFLLRIISALIISKYAVGLDDLVPQQSLIGFYAHNKRHKWSLSIAEYLQCKVFLDQYWCMNPYNKPIDMTRLVYMYVKDGWTTYIKDAKSYKRFNDNMGQLALNRAECGELLGWSLEKPFDEIVIVWHLATDFCFHTYDKSSHQTIDAYCLEMGRAISNYMAHLLFANPEMLMVGTRRNLFTNAYKELEDILEPEKDLCVDDEEKLTLAVIDKLVKSKDQGSFIHNAWKLSQDLRGLGDEQKMWDVIKDVWVEMLCFSAGRCRGYLHAKSLGTGVEYLSYVWLLLSHAGMETFSERLQRRHQFRSPNEEPQNNEAGVTSPSDFEDLKALNHKEKDNPASSSAPQCEGNCIVPELKEIITCTK